MLQVIPRMVTDIPIGIIISFLSVTIKVSSKNFIHDAEKPGPLGPG